MQNSDSIEKLSDYRARSIKRVNSKIQRSQDAKIRKYAINALILNSVFFLVIFFAFAISIIANGFGFIKIISLPLLAFLSITSLKSYYSIRIMTKATIDDGFTLVLGALVSLLAWSKISILGLSLGYSLYGLILLLWLIQFTVLFNDHFSMNTGRHKEVKMTIREAMRKPLMNRIVIISLTLAIVISLNLIF